MVKQTTKTIKCAVASDFHLKEIETPAADLLLVAGDMTMKGSHSEPAWYERWLVRQPQKH